MIFSVFSDLHAHNFKQFSKLSGGGLNSRLLDAKSVLEHIADYNVKHKIKVTLFAGDLFHTFAHVENDVMNVIAGVLFKWPGDFVYVFGNHDLKVKEFQEGHGKGFAGSAIFERLGGAVMLDNGFYNKDAEFTVFGLGWRRQEEFLKVSGENKADILLGHQLPANQNIPGGVVLPENVINNYKLIILGDLHKPCWLKPVKLLVPGAPLQHNFNDEGQERGFWTVDTETWKPTFHVIDFTPKFHTVSVVEDVPAFTLVNGRTVPNIDFYRVEGVSCFEAELPENVLARRESKQDFRESGLSPVMEDAKLCEEYIKLQATDIKDTNYLRRLGVEILEKFESKALAPSGWILSQVGLRGFMSVRGSLLFDFKAGLHLVSGENGVGKTTIFEAVHWCLFGSTTKGVAAADVVNDADETAACEVKVFFSDLKGSTLTVKRTRLEFCFWVSDDEISSNEAAGVIQRESQAATRDELQRVLGMDETMFKNVCYFSQDGFEFFSTMTDAGQKELCKSIRRIDRFESAEAEAKRLFSYTSGKRDEAIDKKGIDEARLSEKRTAADNLSRLAAEWEIERTRRLGEVDKKLFELFNMQMGGLAPKMAVLDEELSELDGAGRAITLRSPSPALQEAVTGAKAELADAVRAQSMGMAGLTTETEAAADEVKRLTHEVAATDGELKSVQEECLLLAHQIGSLMFGNCPTCGQQVKDASVLAKMEEGRGAAEARTFSLMDNKKKLAEAIKAATDKYNKLRGAWGDRNSGYEVSRSQKDDVLRMAERALAEDCGAANAEYERAVAGIRSKISVLKSKRLDMERRLRELNAEKYAMEQEREHLTKQKNESAVALAEVAVEIKRLEQSIQNWQGHLDAMSNELLGLEFWQKGFSDQGLVSYLLDGFAKDFTEAMNVALLPLSGGRFSAVLSTQRKLKGREEWREKFELSVFVDGKKRPYKALSGGQKARVNLAAAVALNSIVKNQFGLSGQPLGVMILDELITELDSEGAEAMYGVLEGLADGCAVYAVTHQDSFKSLFSDVVSVSYDKEKMTTVVEVS